MAQTYRVVEAAATDPEDIEVWMTIGTAIDRLSGTTDRSRIVLADDGRPHHSYACVGRLSRSAHRDESLL